MKKQGWLQSDSLPRCGAPEHVCLFDSSDDSLSVLSLGLGHALRLPLAPPPIPVDQIRLCLLMSFSRQILYYPLLRQLCVFSCSTWI